MFYIVGVVMCLCMEKKGEMNILSCAFNKKINASIILMFFFCTIKGVKSVQIINLSLEVRRALESLSNARITINYC